jgi:hypothetical protein
MPAPVIAFFLPSSSRAFCEPFCAFWLSFEPSLEPFQQVEQVGQAEQAVLVGQVVLALQVVLVVLAGQR